MRLNDAYLRLNASDRMPFFMLVEAVEYLLKSNRKNLTRLSPAGLAVFNGLRNGIALNSSLLNKEYGNG